MSNPDALYKPASYVHVGVATGTRMVFLAGQVARDSAGETVGLGDLAAQTEQAYLNVDPSPARLFLVPEKETGRAR